MRLHRGEKNVMGNEGFVCREVFFAATNSFCYLTLSYIYGEKKDSDCVFSARYRRFIQAFGATGKPKRSSPMVSSMARVSH